MMELRIDDVCCDIAIEPTTPLSFDIATLADVEGARSGRTVDVVLPSTPTNDALFASSYDGYATTRFNDEHHTARIVKEGLTLLEGTAYLMGSTIEQGRGCNYRVRIREGGAEWIDRVVHATLDELDIAFEGDLTLATIAQSWEGDSAVRFLPVTRSEGVIRYSSDSTLPVARMMLTDDYFPFISVAEMVRAMFRDSGYTLRSNFFASELGGSLYMSGHYRHHDGSAAKAKCDFLARRTAEHTATADYAGRVYASTAFATHTVGAIVDTADEGALDEEGQPMHDTFNLNGVFGLNDVGNASFTPPSTVQVGFMLHLDYTTDYKILSRTEFLGFDTIGGLNELSVRVPLANTCTDHRTSPQPSLQYRALVFDHNEGAEYMLTALHSDSTISTIGSWSSRSAIVTTPSKAISSLTLLYRNGGTAWQSYEGDWALYAGYIEEEGRVDVEVDVRIPSTEVAANTTLVLDKFWFGGAEMGMSLTVGRGTTLRPYFTVVPGYGTPLRFADVAHPTIRQSTLLEALGQMFNLAFYTDPLRKEVHIEPLEELYSDEVVDWSGRIVGSEEILISDTGIGTPEGLLLAYREGDYATLHFNSEEATTLGQWQHTNTLYGTTNTTRQVRNTLFTTTLNTTDVVGGAPSASIPQVDDAEADGTGIEAIFTPRILCYKGMRELPEGEVWSAESGGSSYPYAAFVDDDSVNLCYEDRNGMAGLHRHYLPMLQRRRSARNITLTLQLTDAEVATLHSGDGTPASLRSRFHLDILGAESLYRLVAIEQWQPDKGTLRCTFEQELNR